MSTRFDALRARLADINALTSSIAMMDWDQQTYMPPGGADARAEHVGRLSRMAHEALVSDEMRSALEGATGEASTEEEKALVRIVRRDFDLSTKIPTSLVAEKSRLAALAHEIWVKARAENDFKSFAPTLKRMFEIAGEEAEHLGYKQHIYDALLDQYEEGATAADARAMFEAVKPRQVALVKAISEAEPIDDSMLYGSWDEAKQSAYTQMLARTIGFDFERGRQDTAPHPFCTGWSVGDIRLTTRYKPYLGAAIFGTMHEAGHGMYEQGSPMKWDRTPLAGGVSLGVHESQSRLWENIVGRSRPFWEHFYPSLHQQFPELGSLSAEGFYKAVNKVEASFIRVEADELTYNLHILTRFELECDVLTGDMAVADLPEAWNSKYETYMGIRPKSDSEGVLQDVHWSGGSIGYFPTYSMGNLLSYQIWEALGKDVPNTDDLIRKGDFKPILGWLTDKIYSKGHLYTPKELILRATGKPMDPTAYLDGLERKYKEVYSL